MSDQKRTPLISINAGKKDKSRKVLEKTIRFNVTLPESTEEEYPEFDYNVMLRSAEKKQALKKKRTEANGHGNGIAGIDSDDDQQAIKEIARHFEEKYGGKTRIQNLSELGAGYDESDSFIDNSEAVDEALSENVTTQYGGYYINCGALELKNIKVQSDDDTDSVHGNNKKYKRLVNTIEEESDSDDNEKSTSSSPAGSAPSITNNGDHPKVPNKKEMILSGNGEETWRKKRKLLENSSEQPNKKRTTESVEDNSSKTVKELLREKREKQGQRTLQENVKESIDDAIESVVNASRAHHKQTKAAVSNSLSSTSPAVKTTLAASSTSTTPAATSLITQQSSVQNITINNPSDNVPSLEITKIKSSIKTSNSETKSISNSIAVTPQSSVSSTSLTSTPSVISSSKTSVNTVVKTTQASSVNSLPSAKVPHLPPPSNPPPIVKAQPQPVITAAPGKVAQQASVNIPQTGKAALRTTTTNSNVGKIAQAPPVTATSTASSDDDSDSSSSSSDSSSSDSDDSGEDKDTEEREQINSKEEAPKPQSPVNTPLPNGLSEDIIKLVDSLKEVSAQSNEGKFKFFNAEVNQIILNLEKRTRHLPTSTRTEIYGHSAQFTPCTKETLARRAKKLHIGALETRISSTKTKLQESVNTIKPSVLSNYSKLCMKLAEENPQFYWELSRYYWTIGDDGGPQIPNEIMANLPPKKFPWTNELRRLMDTIIKLKSQTFDKSKPRKLEQLLKMFLETEIKSIWPTGWMTVNELMEEARKYKPMPRKQNKTKLTTNNKEPEITEIPISKEATKNSSGSSKKEPLVEIHSFPTDLSKSATKSLSNPTKSTKVNHKVEVAQSKPSEKPGIASQGNNLVENSESIQFIPSVKHTKQNAQERSESSSQAKRQKLDTPISSNSLQIEQVFLPPVESIKKLRPEPESLTNDPLSLEIPSVKSDPDTFAHVIDPLSHHINMSKHLKLKSDLEIHASKSKSKTPPALSPSVSISPVTIRDTNSTYSRPPTINQQNNHHRSQIKVKSPGSISKSDLIMVPSNRATPELGVIQKAPSTLTMVNIPDCISITPSQPTQSQASLSQSTSPSTRPMSLKHRILQETALSRLENDGIEVIEILNEKKSLAKSQIKTPPPQNQQQQLPQQQHPQRSNTPKQSKTKIHKTEIKSSASPQPPIQTKNRSNPIEMEETAAATNILSQINDSIHYNDNEKLVQELSQPLLPPKEEIKPKEDPVQLEVDRVMKELMELQGKAEREKSPDVLEVSHSRNSDLDKLALRSDLYLRNDFPDEFHKHLFPEKSPRIPTTNSLLGSPPRPRNRPELPSTHTSPYFRQSSPPNEPFSLSLGSRMNHSAPPAHMNDIKSEQGTLPDFISNIPTGDESFTLPQFFQQFGQSFSGERACGLLKPSKLTYLLN